MEVRPRVSGYIQKIHVKVGDTVKAGDPLITILSEVSELNVSTAKNIYEPIKSDFEINFNHFLLPEK